MRESKPKVRQRNVSRDDIRRRESERWENSDELEQQIAIFLAFKSSQNVTFFITNLFCLEFLVIIYLYNRSLYYYHYNSLTHTNTQFPLFSYVRLHSTWIDSFHYFLFSIFVLFFWIVINELYLQEKLFTARL